MRTRLHTPRRGAVPLSQMCLSPDRPPVVDRARDVTPSIRAGAIRATCGRIALVLLRPFARLPLAPPQIGAQGFGEPAAAVGVIVRHASAPTPFPHPAKSPTHRPAANPRRARQVALTNRRRQGHRRGLVRGGSPCAPSCCRSSVVERILGKAEVVSSILTGSTIFIARFPHSRGRLATRRQISRTSALWC